MLKVEGISMIAVEVVLGRYVKLICPLIQTQALKVLKSAVLALLHKLLDRMLFQIPQ
jgi:hypothetical protein